MYIICYINYVRNSTGTLALALSAFLIRYFQIILRDALSVATSMLVWVVFLGHLSQVSVPGCFFSISMHIISFNFHFLFSPSLTLLRFFLFLPFLLFLSFVIFLVSTPYSNPLFITLVYIKFQCFFFYIFTPEHLELWIAEI